MDHEFVTRIDIGVPVAGAWHVLTDFPCYGEWCPMLRAVNGRPERGAKLKLRLAKTPGSDETIGLPATVRVVEPPHQLAWGGGVPGLPFLLDVNHWFRIEPLSDERCRFHHGERFRGVILKPMWPQIQKRAAGSYEAFNNAFKQRCEALYR